MLKALTGGGHSVWCLCSVHEDKPDPGPSVTRTLMPLPRTGRHPAERHAPRTRHPGADEDFCGY